MKSPSFAILLSVLLFTACGGPEEKAAKFMNQGNEHFKTGEYVAARLDYKNVLQIHPKHGEGYFKLAETELKLKNYKAAFQAYGKAAQYNPGNLEAELALGKLLLAARQFDRAGEKADLVLSKAAGHLEAKVLKASVLLAGKRAPEAIDLLKDQVSPGLQIPSAFSTLALAHFQENNDLKGKEIVEMGIMANPDAIALRIIMASYEARHNNMEGAAEQLEKAIALQPDNLKLSYQLVELYWNFEQQGKAREIITHLVARETEYERAYLQGASFYKGKREMGEAEGLLNQGIAKHPQSFKLRFALSEIKVQQNDTDGAHTILQDCLAMSEDQEDSNIIQTKLYLAKLHMAEREIAKASTYVDEVLRESPKNVEGHYIKGKLLLYHGLGEEAVTELRAVVDDKPQFTQGYLLLAQAHTFNRKPGLAMEALAAGLKVQPDSSDLLIARSKLQAQGKDYAAAEQTLRKLLSKKPNDTMALIELGDLLTVNRKFDQAEEEYLKIVIDHPENPVGYLKLGQLNALQKDWTAAAEILVQGQERIANPSRLLGVLIKVYLASDNYNAAVAACEKEIERSPKSPLAYTLLGQLYAAYKKFPEAESMLQKAIQLEPTFQDPYNILAAVKMDQGKEQQAIAEVKALQKANPENNTAYLFLGAIYERIGDKNQAREAYRQLLEKQPDSWVAANNLAYRLIEDTPDPEKLNEALTLAEKAVKIRPDKAIALDTLGWVHYRRGELEKAAVRLEQALEKSPDNPIINYHAAMVLHKSGRNGEAREKINKALISNEEFPDRPEAEKLQEEIL